jgi:WD repeat-containing protein 61
MSYRTSDIFKEGIHDDSVWSAAWINDKIVTGSVNAEVKVWTLKNNEIQLLYTLLGHRLGVISVDVDKTGKYAVSSSMDSCIRVWDIEKGLMVNNIEAPPIEAWTVSLSPDGKHVATGSQTGNVNIFNIETGQKELSLDSQKKSFCMSVAYSPNGRFVACGLQDGSVVIFDVSTSSIVHHLNAHSMSVRTLAFTEDSSLLLTGSDDKHIHVHDVKSGTTAHVLSGHDSFIFCIRVSPDKKHFASCSSDRTVRIWELSTMECIHIFENVHKDQIWSLAYNNDGSLLASVGSDLSLRLYHCPLDESK